MHLVFNPVVPGRGTGPGLAKVAKLPGWARRGAGPALWYRAGVRGRVRKNRRHARLGSRGRRAGTPGPPGSVLVSPGCGPVHFELLPGYRAEPAKISFSYIKPILSGTGLSWQKLKTWGGPARVPGWTFGAGFGGTGLGPPGCWAGAPGWANPGWTFGAGFGGTGLGPLGCWAGAAGWAN